MKCVLHIEHLRKAFEERVVLQDVTLCLFQGENLVILGRSGTGKSVLLKCIIGLIMPDEGTVEVLGRRIDTLSSRELMELRRRVGFSFQGSALYDSMTVRENLEFPLRRNLGIDDPRELKPRVEEALEAVGLSHAIDQQPSELSGGMRKRIGIARTLILRPEIMLYDEPTAGLDPETSTDINDLINEVRKVYHTSSIIITHDIACAKTTADRIIFLKDGLCYNEGSFAQMSREDDPLLQTFFNYFKVSS
nr:ATP-binding cassette domain-containing protein [Catalinimonas alkaloidigena]